MSQLMDLRLPGLGLAPARDTQRVNEREREAILRDDIARVDAIARAEATPCGRTIDSGRFARFRRVARSAAF
jgi:hypothetical protein